MAKKVSSPALGDIVSLFGNNTASKVSSTQSMEQKLIDEAWKFNERGFEFNSAEAKKERDWSQQMSNTSHQREVEDLRKAGLNPVLSANGGASAYSGASASGSSDQSSLSAIANIYMNEQNNANAVKIAQMNNNNSLEIAKINAAAQKYASDNSYSASRYASDNSYNASTYGADRSMYGTVNQLIEGVTGGSTKNTASKVVKTVTKYAKKLFSKKKK